MYTIALTGGIGSGKTTVANLFKEKKIPVIDTDIIARNLAEIGEPAYKKILEAFGANIINPDKSIAREKLRTLIFSSDEKRRQLEKILHPLIWEEVAAQLSRQDAAYAIVVVPLLFESIEQLKINPEKSTMLNFDRILVIDAPENEQIKRVQMRDGSDDVTIRNILNSQVTSKTRLKGADDVIFNTLTMSELKHEVEILHQKYLSLAV